MPNSQFSCVFLGARMNKSKQRIVFLITRPAFLEVQASCDMESREMDMETCAYQCAYVILWCMDMDMDMDIYIYIIHNHRYIIASYLFLFRILWECYPHNPVSLSLCSAHIGSAGQKRWLPSAHIDAHFTFLENHHDFHAWFIYRMVLPCDVCWFINPMNTSSLYLP